MADERPRPFIHCYRSGIVRAQLPGSLKLVLLTLAEFANETGGDCFPSMTKVAAFAGVNEKTVRRLLQSPTPWLSRVERAGKEKGWRAYGYQLLIPAGADTRPARWKAQADEGQDTTPAPSPFPADMVPAPAEASCGHSEGMVRTLPPDGAGMVSADVGFEIGNSKLEEQEQPTLIPADPIFIHLQARDGSEVPVSELQVAELSRLYPAVDVQQQLRSMRGWLGAKPANRKTRDGMQRFIHGWLNRAVTDAGNRPRAASVTPLLPRDTRPQSDLDAANAQSHGFLEERYAP